MLTIAKQLEEKKVTKGGLIMPDVERTSIPLRAQVIAAPMKLIKEGMLPGDVILFTATREKISIEFQPSMDHNESLLAIPTECIVTFIPARAEVRKKAIEHLQGQYDEELLKLLNRIGDVENVSVKNEWRYGG